ncbi:hypothetical protein ACFQ1I_35680 [Kitasatospora arboriphila]
MSVADLARKGDTAAVAAALAELAPEQRRAEVPALRALRKELRDSWSGSPDRWTALLVAAAAATPRPPRPPSGSAAGSSRTASAGATRCSSR